jgi:hypothetical protein
MVFAVTLLDQRFSLCAMAKFKSEIWGAPETDIGQTGIPIA